ncbi:MAG: hypothetical protein E6Q97_24475 [Desulfurellales bacterium]|nr:MAG: hypothetical protein E6Q97_24475 [Desulfurellales bacterium]
MAANAGAIRAGKAVVEIGTENGPLSRGLRAAAGKIKGFTAGVTSLGPVLGNVLSTGLSILSTGAKTAGVAIGGITAGLAAATAAFLATDKRLLSPEEAAAAKALQLSLTGLQQSAQHVVAALMTQLQPAISTVIDIVRLGMRAFQNWIGTQKELIASVTEFLGGIRDALAAGDIALAANILWAGIKVAFQAGITAIMQPWTEWKTSFQQTASEAFLGVLKIANDVWQAMRAAARATGDFLTDSFGSAVDWTAQKLIDLQEATGILTQQEGDDMRRTLTEDQERAARDKQRDRNARDQAIEEERRKREEEFGQSVLDANEAIAQANNAQLEQSRRDLQTAKDELAGLIGQARDKAPRADLKPPDIVNLAERTTSTTGTFSAAAARGLGGVNPLKKVEDNTKAAADAAKQQQELLEEIRDKIDTRYTA